MGRAKEQWMEMQEEWANKCLASTFGISHEELDQLQWEIYDDRSKDGMLYGYRVEFYEGCPIYILNKIKGLEDGCRVNLLPWEFDDGIDEEELEWEIEYSDQLKIFHSHLKTVNQLLNVEFDEQTQFNVLVMLHVHIVAAMEHFLSSTFIHKITNSTELIRKLIETDPEFGNRKFTLNKIFFKQEELKVTVGSYLKSLIFHDLKKIKPMYRDVINYDFGNVSWLFTAVLCRHDCAHRAGYDKEGNKVSLTIESIEELMINCKELAENIDAHIVES